MAKIKAKTKVKEPKDKGNKISYNQLLKEHNKLLKKNKQTKEIIVMLQKDLDFKTKELEQVKVINKNITKSNQNLNDDNIKLSNKVKYYKKYYSKKLLSIFIKDKK